MVLTLFGLRLRDHLRGAGLAGDVDAGHARRATRPAFVHDAPQTASQERPDERRELHVTDHATGIAPHDALAGALDALHESRFPQHAAVGHGRHHARDLHRRHEHLALTDRHVHGVAGLPRRRPASLADLGLGDEADLLAAEIETGGRAEAEGLRVLRDHRADDLEPRLVEEDVAGMNHRAVHVDGAVAFLLPVEERPRAEVELAGAVRPVGRRDGALLQAGGGHHDLEDRPRRVLALDRAVQQRVRRILHDAHPRLSVDRAGEAIDLEGRGRHHGEHVAGAWIHHHDGAGVVLHRALGRLLDPSIDRRDDLGAGLRLGLRDHADRPAHDVDLDLLAAIATAQELVEQALEAGLAHHVAAAISALLELLVARLADVAEEMRGEPTIRVRTRRLDLDDHARELELPLLDLRDVFERQAATDPDGLERLRRHSLHGI